MQEIPYVLIARDRVIMNSVVNFIRGIRDPFIRAQAHSMLRSLLVLMVKVPEAATFLQENETLGPSLFIAMLDMADNIRRVPNESRRRAYLDAVLRTIVAWLDPKYTDRIRDSFASETT